MQCIQIYIVPKMQKPKRKINITENEFQISLGFQPTYIML